MVNQSMARQGLAMLLESGAVEAVQAQLKREAVDLDIMSGNVDELAARLKRLREQLLSNEFFVFQLKELVK